MSQVMARAAAPTDTKQELVKVLEYLKPNVS